VSAAEFGVVMLLYLKHAWERSSRRGAADEATLLEALREGAVLRVRPKAMTVAVVMAGLLPIMLGSGTGSEVMQRIAAPDGGRHDHRAAALDVRDSRGVPADEAPRIATEIARGVAGQPPGDPLAPLRDLLVDPAA
jgi:hypothetical protein